MSTRVSKETAILLKEAGYDVPCEYGICEDGAIVKRDSTMWSDWIIAPAPTLHEASDWLRSKGVHVVAAPNFDDIPSQWVYEVFSLDGKDWNLIYSVSGYHTFESAYEAAIVHGLKHIK